MNEAGIFLWLQQHYNVYGGGGGGGDDDDDDDDNNNNNNNNTNMKFKKKLSILLETQCQPHEIILTLVTAK